MTSSCDQLIINQFNHFISFHLEKMYTILLTFAQNSRLFLKHRLFPLMSKSTDWSSLHILIKRSTNLPFLHTVALLKIITVLGGTCQSGRRKEPMEEQSDGCEVDCRLHLYLRTLSGSPSFLHPRLSAQRIPPTSYKQGYHHRHYVTARGQKLMMSTMWQRWESKTKTHFSSQRLAHKPAGVRNEWMNDFSLMH